MLKNVKGMNIFCIMFAIWFYCCIFEVLKGTKEKHSTIK